MTSTSTMSDLTSPVRCDESKHLNAIQGAVAPREAGPDVRILFDMVYDVVTAHVRVNIARHLGLNTREAMSALHFHNVILRTRLELLHSAYDGQSNTLGSREWHDRLLRLAKVEAHRISDKRLNQWIND